MDTPSHFGNKLLSLRGLFCFAQKEVAYHLGVSQKTYSNWEVSNSCPKQCDLSKLAALYNVSEKFIMDFDPALFISEIKHRDELFKKIRVLEGLDLLDAHNLIDALIRYSEVSYGKKITISISIELK
jgi:transcriptional regulator with XRE-family HTH domain